MENASDALLIAGGILLAILVLSLLMYMFNHVNLFESSKVEKEEIKDLAEWNAQWEAYNKKLLYGAEVITIINKANQNNAEYDEDEDYMVHVTVLQDEVEINKEDINRTAIFQCTETKYHEETGRVNEIIFCALE